jgi:hypothetical protein
LRLGVLFHLGNLRVQIIRTTQEVSIAPKGQKKADTKCNDNAGVAAPADVLCHIRLILIHKASVDGESKLGSIC